MISFLSISLTFVLGAQKKHLNEMVLFSTHNINWVEKSENYYLIKHSHFTICICLLIIYVNDTFALYSWTTDTITYVYIYKVLYASVC